MEICTNDNSTYDTLIMLDTDKVPKSKETICECNIVVHGIEDTFHFNINNSKMASGLSFEINDLVFLNQTITKNSTTVTNAATLKMSTSSNFKKGGACLIVQSGKVLYCLYT